MEKKLLIATFIKLPLLSCLTIYSSSISTFSSYIIFTHYISVNVLELLIVSSLNFVSAQKFLGYFNYPVIG